MCTTSSYRRARLVSRSYTLYSFSSRIRLLHGLRHLKLKICSNAKIGKKTGEIAACTGVPNFVSNDVRLPSPRSTPLVSYGPYRRDHRRCVCRGRGGAQV